MVRYNGVDLKTFSSEQLSAKRGIVFGRDLTLFEGTVKDNILLGRPNITSEDVLWAVALTQLDKELEKFPDGLETLVKEGGKEFPPSQRLRILLAMAIITRPPLVILDGGMHEIPNHIREPILYALSSKDRPWTLIIVTTDPHAKTFVEKSWTLF